MHKSQVLEEVCALHSKEKFDAALTNLATLLPQIRDQDRDALYAMYSTGRVDQLADIVMVLRLDLYPQHMAQFAAMRAFATSQGADMEEYRTGLKEFMHRAARNNYHYDPDVGERHADPPTT